MGNIKDELREVIIQITAEKMAPFLAQRVSASKGEMIETFKRLVHYGRVKIGIMPFEEEGEDQFHSVTFIKSSADEDAYDWMALETGNPVELQPGLERVFTLTEEQYQLIYGDNLKS